MVNGPALPGASSSPDDVASEVDAAVGSAGALGAAVAPDDGGGLIGDRPDSHPDSATSPMQAVTTRLLMFGC